MKKSIITVLAVFLLSLSTQAEVLKSQPVCASQVHQILMDKVGAQEVQKSYSLLGVVQGSNFVAEGTSCELVISITEAANGQGTLNVREVRTNLMFPFVYSIHTTRDAKVCRQVSLTGQSIYRQDHGWRKTFNTSLRLTPQRDGKLVIYYAQKEGRVFPSGDELTCIF